MTQHALIACLLYFVTWLPFAAMAGNPAPIDLAQTPAKSLEISDRYVTLRDPAGTLTVRDIMAPGNAKDFTALKAGEKPNFGYTADTFWLRLDVVNSSAIAEERLLEIPYPILSFVDFYQVIDGQVVSSHQVGLALPMSARPINTRNFVFPVRLQENARSTIYLRIRSDNALVVPTTLWQTAAYADHRVADYAWQSAYFGIAFAMLIFNLLIFIEFRESIYLRYVLYVAMIIFMSAAQQGLGKQFLWPQTTSWSNIALYVGYSLAGATFYQLSREMLNLNAIAPAVDKLFAGIALGFAFSVPAYFIVFQPIVPAVSIAMGLSLLLAGGVGVYCAYRGQRSAFFFLVAFVPIIVGGVTVVMRSLHIVPLNDLTLNAVQIGSAMELILLAFALADRFNQTRREREAAVEQAERAVSLAAAYAEAEQARKAAEAANAMKNDFLAMISHEVRTPLGGVIGMIKFGLRDRGLQSATREKLDLGLANAESLLQIINDILDYSKLEAGKMTLEVMDFDLPKLVRDTVAMLAERAESKGLSLVYEIEADFPQWWHSDPTRLRQVLVNLAGNAIKFTEEGEVRIAVLMTAEGMEVTVRDTGIGIAAEALPRLFQKFEQADASTSRRFGGTGLGLAICKQIVEAMGGTIAVESTLGVGTTFRMALPLNQGQPVIGSETDRAAEHRYRLNILCAEDGMTNQVILRELVTSMGHTFTLAEDGEAALVALSQADYDLLLLDSRMPRLDGLDVLKALRAGERNVRQPELAVIAVTANAGKEERERFMAAGAQGFLPKPIDEHALQVEIGRVIEWLLEREHVLPVIESTTAEPSPQLDAGNTALAAPGAMSASPAMRQAFLTEGPRLLGELRKALDAGDGATAARSAHSLKGMAGYFAAPDLQEHARLAEHAADAGNLDEAREQLAYMQASVERVLAVLGGEAVTSVAPSPANVTQTLSQDELNTLLATLEQQLARSSLDAETTLATLRDGLPAGKLAELAAQMARQLEVFDFAAAKTTFHDMSCLSARGGTA